VGKQRDLVCPLDSALTIARTCLILTLRVQARADPKDRLALAREVIAKLNAGNKRYVDHVSGKIGKGDLRNTSGVEMLEDDPLSGAKAPMAVVVSCARSCGAFGSACKMFDTAPGELQMIRTMANIIGNSGSMIASIELALGLAEEINELPPVVLVVGNTQNDLIEEAVIRAMTAQGRGDSCPKPKVFKGQQDAPLVLLDQMVKVARDALDQQPNATFVRLCELTNKLNLYQTIEDMMTSSRYIFDLVAAEQIFLLAGVFDVETKRVSFLGDHPSKARLLKTPPLLHYVRTAADEEMPAEEALAVLYAGNQRYIGGQGGILNRTVDQDQLRKMTAESGQNPQAIVLGCADSRASLEIFFDVKPGDIFVLRNAGNTCPSSRDMMIGSAEYAILHLRTKLVVVTGHTKCGAVNAAIQTVQQYAKERGLEQLTPQDIDNMIASLEGTSGSIGNVLQNIVRNAAEAIRQLPKGDMKELMDLTIEINVFSTIEKLIQNSEVMRKGVASGDLLVHGTVYNISSGAVKWLGPHPRLQEIVQAEMPMHVWNTTPYVRSESAAPSAEVQKIITRFKEGNERFLNGETMLADTPPSAIDPFAIVLAGAEKHTAVEKIFDVLRTPPPPLLLLHPLPCCSPCPRPGQQLRLRAFLAALPPSLRVALSLCSPVSECTPSLCWQRASSSCSATWASSRAAGTVRCSSR
jgi:carbonic anhydrase